MSSGNAREKIATQKILVGYVRVSGDSQADNTSLPTQREEITSYCKKNGYKLFNIFEDVYSAESAEKREGFQDALACIFSNLADGLIVYKLDRFARKVLDAETIKRDLQERGKKLLTVVDTLDLETPDGELMFQFKGMFAEYERKLIYQRCQEGRRKKKEAGGSLGGSPPFGWRPYKGGLVPVPEEQAVLERIRTMADEGVSFTKIANILNAEGIPTKKKGRWHSASFYNLLNGQRRSLVRLGFEVKDAG
ncbi:MAG: recombinase family protein [Cyanobacteria bacterium SZAS LIN-3]|nr:recombinase family protein [Cyanobacteria bacterium SZAS LIN-3]